MNMSRKRVAVIAWILCGLVGAGAALIFVQNPIDFGGNTSIISVLGDLIWMIFPLVFAVVAALIVSKLPQHPIGWLLIVPAVLFVIAIPVENYLESFGNVPPEPTPSILLLTWFYNWSWLPLIFPLILIPLLFPTGKPPSPRWGKVIQGLLVLFLIFLFLGTFNASFSPVDGGWRLDNPIGFIPDQVTEMFVFPWLLALAMLAVLCIVSLFIRYRDAGAVERKQIKWLLYASGMFALVYVPSLVLGWEESQSELFNLLFILAIIMIPVSIAIAILRYRLFDIDILIRKTLVYGGLSITLGTFYFAGVVVLQSVFETISGQQSPLAIVLSTLLIAALFNPLRRRIQNAIDRRFYRSKYNAQKTLETFAMSARNEADLDTMIAELMEVVEATMQPEQASLWLRETGGPG
jgi:hypothetical protein